MLAFAMCDARPSSSSGGSRSFSSPSRSYSSPSRSSSPSSGGWGSSSKPSSTSPSSGWGSSSKPSGGSSYTHSNADDALSNKVKQSGSSPITRSHAEEEHRNVSAPRPSNNGVSRPVRTNVHYRYTSEPSVWPSGLPRSYYYGGYHYNVIYDPFYHGYGWYVGSRWFYYDVMFNAANAVAYNNAYNNQPVAVYSNGDSGAAAGIVYGMLVIIGLVVVFVIIAATITWYNNYRETRRYNTPVDYSPTTYSTPRSTYLPATSVKPNSKLDKWTGKADITRVSPGNVIGLKDALSMEDARKLNPKSNALGVTVTHVTRVQEKNGFATWTFIHGKSETGQALLIGVKDVDGNRDIVCYTLDVTGTRRELINAGNNWLFVSPDDVSNYNPMDLAYTSWFSRKLDGDNEDVYEQKEQGELHGVATFNPVRPGPETLATVVEYACGRTQACDQYLVAELGLGKQTIVEGWWGARVDAKDIVLT